MGQAVSSSLDLPTVLTTIVSRSVGLSGAAGGAIYEYDEAGEEFYLRATDGLPDDYVQIGRQGRRGEGATGRLAFTHAPVAVRMRLASRRPRWRSGSDQLISTR